MLKDSLAVTSLALLNLPEWALPALAQGETLVPFTDAPPAFPAPGPGKPPIRHPHDRRPVQPRRSFLYDAALRSSCRRAGGVPAEVDGASESAAVVVARRACARSAAPNSSPDSNVRAIGGRFRDLCGNGRWTGVPLRAVLDRAAASSRRRASSSSSAPIAARKRWNSGRRSSRLNSSTAAA